MTYKDHIRRCATEYLAALLASHGGKVSAAAAAAGMSRTYLYRLLHQYGLRKAAARGNAEWRAL